MGKFITDPIPKGIQDPGWNWNKLFADEIKSYVDNIRNPYWPDPSGPHKFYNSEGLQPFILSMPHNYISAPSAEETRKAGREMIDTMIQYAEYQITILKAHIEALKQQKENIKEQD